jgi:hypothetical protein
MKKFTPLFAVMFLLASATTAYAQKMVVTPNDAKKLVENKELFIGNPLKVLLDSIGLTIKMVFGNPENTSGEATGGTFFWLTFVERSEYKESSDKKQRPTTIVVNFPLDPQNKHKPLPEKGINVWTEEETKEYGDMIVLKIRVIGENSFGGQAMYLLKQRLLIGD